MCHTLLQHMDKDPVHQRTYEGGCLIIPHGTQYRTLFPEIIMPHNHWGPLIDHNTGEPYPMATVGDFCLMDPLFPGSSGESLLFKGDDLDRLKRKSFHISTYREEKPQPTIPKTNTSLLHQGECAELLPQGGGITKTSDRNSGASSPWTPDSTSSKKSSRQGKCSPLAKGGIRQP